MSQDERWVTTQELLTEEVDEELRRREGNWDAFRHQVMARVEQYEAARVRGDLEDQAIRHLEEEVELELASSAPAFEGPFREVVEARIFREGMNAPARMGWLDRLRTWFTPTRTGFGLAAAGMATALVLSVSGPTETSLPSVDGTAGVTLDDLEVDGTATVMSLEDVTVVVLTGA